MISSLYKEIGMKYPGKAFLLVIIASDFIDLADVIDAIWSLARRLFL